MYLDSGRYEYEQSWLLTNEVYSFCDRLQWIPRGEHCEWKVSGAIPTVGANSYYWMVEVLLIVMRLEATTAGCTQFNVPSSSSATGYD